jgi:division protein CdvB (Snf7/Vps24/ESCRT-III family)
MNVPIKTILELSYLAQDGYIKSLEEVAEYLGSISPEAGKDLKKLSELNQAVVFNRGAMNHSRIMVEACIHSWEDYTKEEEAKRVAETSKAID